MTTPAWPYLDHPGPIPFAHRGGAAERPENTMAAFQHAVDLGYRYLETDVRVTADGVALAFHDPVLDRVTDHTGVVEELTWGEVAGARVEGTEPVTRLEDVLGTWPDARVNIDIKTAASVQPLVDVLRRTQSYGRVCVASFSDRRLARFRRLTAGQVCTAIGPSAIARVRAAWRGRPPGPMAGACAQVPLVYKGIPVVDAAFVAAAHARGIAVHVWTIDEPAEIARLLDLGVDGIMTDRPTVLKEAMASRGAWA